MSNSKYADFFIRDNCPGDGPVIEEVYIQQCYRLAILQRSHRSGPQFVVDIGAHIGSFTRHYHELNPQARIASVEACPENMQLLEMNVGSISRVIHAACTYEEDFVLANAVFDGGEYTGGSTVTTSWDSNEFPPNSHFCDVRDIPAITLEQIMSQSGEEGIDILKLDCEGSEISILRETTSLDRVGLIVGEFHERDDWEPLRMSVAAGWPYSIQNGGGSSRSGIFHLRNPNWNGCWSEQ